MPRATKLTLLFEFPDGTKSQQVLENVTFSATMKDASVAESKGEIVTIDWSKNPKTYIHSHEVLVLTAARVK